MCVDLSLGFLFCSIDLYVCLCASTMLSWWLWLCSRAWSQAGWFLQFHSSFSRLLWLFEVFCTSIQIVKLFVLALWIFWILTKTRLPERVVHEVSLREEEGWQFYVSVVLLVCPFMRGWLSLPASMLFPLWPFGFINRLLDGQQEEIQNSFYFRGLYEAYPFKRICQCPGLVYRK